MSTALGIICIGVGIRFTTTHPETIYAFGSMELTYSHVLFAAGALFIVRGIWKWVND